METGCREARTGLDYQLGGNQQTVAYFLVQMLSDYGLGLVFPLLGGECLALRLYNRWRPYSAFVRQLVIWMVLVVTPTPGGSGFGEYMFQSYYSDFFSMAGTALVVACLWRIITYYSYLIGGVCILPGWLRMINKQK